MCELCSVDKEERDHYVRKMEYEAQTLEEMVRHIRNCAYGHIKPHTPEFAKGCGLSHRCVRALIDWID